MVSVSVCMATYNGGKTIAQQLNSIVEQLSQADELIIIDDCSSDNTILIVRQALANFSGSVTIEKNKTNLGPIKSFEKGLSLAKNDLIFLSDQDDVWFSNKVQIISNIYQQEHDAIILHDAHVVDKNGQVIDESWNHYNHNSVNQSVLGNLLKNGYTGAMMAISRNLVQASLPFPSNIEMHDQWLFLVAKKNRMKISFIDQPLMNYVRHGDNYTGMNKRKKSAMFVGRARMLSDYIHLKRSF